MVDDVKNTEFYRFLGKLVFEPEACGWETFSPKQQEHFCACAEAVYFQSFLLRMLNTKLPEKFYQPFRDVYRQESLKRMVEGKKLSHFLQLISEEKIPCVPLKGTDLAYRVYPDPAMRPHNDWDILFRPDDCLKVINILLKQGWTTISGCTPGKPICHHYEVLFYKGQELEVHWTLPSFGSATPEEIWQETAPITEYHRVLTPEMNLLLLSAHARNGEYMHMTACKILLDAGFILRSTKVDWDKVHELADRWGILRPDVLLGAWPEFFPEGVLPQESLNPKHQRLIREVFDLRHKASAYSSGEKSMADSTRNRLDWFRQKLHFYSAPTICYKYHLKEQQRFRIFWYGVWDFTCKACYLLTHLGKRNPELRKYYREVSEIDDLIVRRSPEKH